jgi:hypothetical protein
VPVVVRDTERCRVMVSLQRSVAQRRTEAHGTLGSVKLGAALLAILSAVALAALGAGLAVVESTPGLLTAAQDHLAATACREVSVPTGPASGETEMIAVPDQWLKDLAASGRPELAALVPTIRRAGRPTPEGEQMMKALEDVVSACRALHLRTG